MEGSWKLLSELKDPELKELASRLPATILHSRADSTVKKHLGAYRRWKTWATAHKLDPVPAKPHEFVLYTLVRGPALKQQLKMHVMPYPGSIEAPAYYQSLKIHLLKLPLRAYSGPWLSQLLRRSLLLQRCWRL